MSSPTQIDFEDLRTARPVKCVLRDGARKELGCVDYELDNILSRPSNHQLRLTGVLDLAAPDSTQQHLVFVVACLEEFNQRQTIRRSDDELAVMLFGQLQKDQGVVSIKRVYRALNIRHDHFYKFTQGFMVGRKRHPALLPLAKESEQRRGPGGSAVVQWADLVKFIKQRRVS